MRTSRSSPTRPATPGGGDRSKSCGGRSSPERFLTDGLARGPEVEVDLRNEGFQLGQITVDDVACRLRHLIHDLYLRMRLTGSIGEKRRHVVGNVGADELIGPPELCSGVLHALLVLEHQDLRSV